jgi:hypothetical protein
MIVRESVNNFKPNTAKFLEGKVAVIRLNSEAIGFAVEDEHAVTLARDIKKTHSRYGRKPTVTCRWELRSDVTVEIKAVYAEYNNKYQSIADGIYKVISTFDRWERTIKA